MKTMVKNILAATLVFVAIAVSVPLEVSAASRTIYVDYVSGSDSNVGTSQTKPFKHAPGDRKATGNASAWKYQAGDTVIFKGGVRYRGDIRTRYLSGSEAEPITFKGDGWGGRAIFDGATPLSFTPCISQDDCLGAPNWTQLWKADVPTGSDWEHQIFDTATNLPLKVSQYPSVNTVFDTDDINNFIDIPVTNTPDLITGLIRDAVDPALQLGTPSLGVWGNPNIVYYRKIDAIDVDGIHFSVGNYKAYDDRKNKYTILNSVGALTEPGTFAVDRDASVVVLNPVGGGQSPASRYSIGSGRLAFSLSDASYVTIEGFDMVNFSKLPSDYGAHALKLNQKVNNLTFRNNTIQSFAGSNVFELNNSPYTRVVNNTMSYVLRGRTILTGSKSNFGPIEIGCNTIRYTGGTSVAAFNGHSVYVKNNLIEHSLGVHGNGLSVYLDNRNIFIEGNVIRHTPRPFTMHGDKNNPVFTTGEPSIALRNNFIASDINDGPNAAVRSWGANLKNVLIENNYIWSLYAPLALTAKDKNVTVKNNILAGRTWSANGALDASNTIIKDPNGSQGLAIKSQVESTTPNLNGCSTPVWVGGLPNTVPTPVPSTPPALSPPPTPTPAPVPTTPINSAKTIIYLSSDTMVFKSFTSTSAGTQTKGSKGTYDVSVAARNFQGTQWVKVDFENGVDGYVPVSLITQSYVTPGSNTGLTPQASNQPAQINQNPSVTNWPNERRVQIVENLNLRATPGGAIKKVVPKGTQATVDQTVGTQTKDGITWIYVKLPDGQTGYLSAKYVSDAGTATPNREALLKQIEVLLAQIKVLKERLEKIK
jgi:hypothetical protein